MNEVKKSQFYTLLLYLLPLFYFLSLPISVGDLAVWVRVGQDILQKAEVLRHDTYSILNTSDFIYPVLGPLVYALADNIGGLAFVSLFHKFILLLLIYFLQKFTFSDRCKIGSGKNILYVMLAFAVWSLYFIDRVAFLALLPLLLTYHWAEKLDIKKFQSRDFIKFILLLIVWVNLHGSWPMFFLILAWKFIFNFESKKLILFILAMFASLLAVLVNPFGAKMYFYVLETVKISKARGIDEWNSFNFHDYAPQGYGYLVLSITICYLVFKYYNKNKNLNILKSPFILIWLWGFLAIRNTGFTGFLLLPFLSHYKLLAASAYEEPEKNKMLNVLVVLAVMGLCFLASPFGKQNSPSIFPENKKNIFDDSAPVEFVEKISTSLTKGPICNDWEYGSYLIYRLSNKILIDTRNIIYSENDFFEYQNTMSGDDSWQNFVQRYGCEFILLNKRLRGVLINKLLSNPSWHTLLENENTILFSKKASIKK